MHKSQSSGHYECMPFGVCSNLRVNTTSSGVRHTCYKLMQFSSLKYEYRYKQARGTYYYMTMKHLSKDNVNVIENEWKNDFSHKIKKTFGQAY